MKGRVYNFTNSRKKKTTLIQTKQEKQFVRPMRKIFKL